MPQAIDAGLELADCFIHQGNVNEALELILSTLDHSAITDSARQRASEFAPVCQTRYVPLFAITIQVAPSYDCVFNKNRI
jgi:hypothetical protein